MKNQNGFTLVEAIVVAVIVAVLAITAVLLYQGYITDAKKSAVDNIAQTAAAAGNAYWRKTGSNVPDINTLKLFYDQNKYTIALDGTDNIKVTLKNSSPEISKSISYK